MWETMRIINGVMLVIIGCLCRWICTLKDELRKNDVVIQSLHNRLYSNRIKINKLTKNNEFLMAEKLTINKELKRKQKVIEDLKLFIYENISSNYKRGNKKMNDVNLYEELAMMTNDGKCTDRVLDSVINNVNKEKGFTVDPGELLNGALGLTGESGEVADIIKKHIFHGHPLDTNSLYKELGDVCWYIALLCHALKIDMSDILTWNISKLKKRYPQGFSNEASINRKE